MSNRRPFPDNLQTLFTKVDPLAFQQFAQAHQHWTVLQRMAEVESQIAFLQEELAENDMQLKWLQPSVIALAAIARFQAYGVDDIDLLDTMLERGETWLDQTLQLLEQCEHLGLIGDSYTAWCEHALEGAYDWIASMHSNGDDEELIAAGEIERVPQNGHQEFFSEITEEMLIRRLMSEDETEKLVALVLPPTDNCQDTTSVAPDAAAAQDELAHIDATSPAEPLASTPIATTPDNAPEVLESTHGHVTPSETAATPALLETSDTAATPALLETSDASAKTLSTPEPVEALDTAIETSALPELIAASDTSTETPVTSELLETLNIPANTLVTPELLETTDAPAEASVLPELIAASDISIDTLTPLETTGTPVEAVALPEFIAASEAPADTLAASAQPEATDASVETPELLDISDKSDAALAPLAVGSEPSEETTRAKTTSPLVEVPTLLEEPDASIAASVPIEAAADVTNIVELPDATVDVDFPHISEAEAIPAEPTLTTASGATPDEQPMEPLFAIFPPSTPASSEHNDLFNEYIESETLDSFDPANHSYADTANGQSANSASIDAIAVNEEQNDPFTVDGTVTYIPNSDAGIQAATATPIKKPKRRFFLWRLLARLFRRSAERSL